MESRLLFILYTAHLSKVASHGLALHQYANDCQRSGRRRAVFKSVERRGRSDSLLLDRVFWNNNLPLNLYVILNQVYSMSCRHMSASRLRLSWSGHLADGFHTAKSGQDATIPFCRHRQQTVNTARKLGVIVDSQLTSDHVIRLQGLCVNRRTIGPTARSRAPTSHTSTVIRISRENRKSFMHLSLCAWTTVTFCCLHLWQPSPAYSAVQNRDQNAAARLSTVLRENITPA